MTNTAPLKASRTELSAEEALRLRAQLRDFYEDYGLVLDEGEIEEWPNFFTDDCTYKAISRENYDLNLPLGAMFCDGIGMIKDRVLAIRETAVFEPRSMRHFISGIRIRSMEDDGTIHAQANFLVMEAISNRDPRVFSTGRYIDQIVPSGDTFRFREHLAVFDNYRILSTLVWPL